MNSALPPLAPLEKGYCMNQAHQGNTCLHGSTLHDDPCHRNLTQSCMHGTAYTTTPATAIANKAACMAQRTMAKPACMTNTSAPAHVRKNVLMPSSSPSRRADRPSLPDKVQG